MDECAGRHNTGSCVFIYSMGCVWFVHRSAGANGGVRSPGTGITDSCELLGTKTRSLERASAHTMSGLSPQP